MHTCKLCQTYNPFRQSRIIGWHGLRNICFFDAKLLRKARQDERHASENPAAKPTQTLCSMLKISEERVLRRVRLLPDLPDQDSKGAKAKEFFFLWNAANAEAKRPDLSLFLARRFAQTPYAPAILALPDITSADCPCCPSG
ncbi:hypothetical protein ACFFUT_06630 [Pseudohalocynthiibacter aestuariivivens]|uniref:Uncharacterized protein n=2 Tax=Pseudohalocynthiibacter TaxID=1759417 RepID=A0ABV5JDD5_9RHOB|nr:hypothetical protein [Pseudohalocynthiibacter aestuariivivens]MBS9717049.1 hypothetical protein [Pseudohalocynthiibacter aestuariivivens]